MQRSRHYIRIDLRNEHLKIIQKSNEIMDLCIVVDFTGSMSTYLHALKSSMLEFMHILKLCDDIDRIGILGYTDYCYKEVIRWSGWQNDSKILIPFVHALDPHGGGDIPEAAKTAVFELKKIIEKKTLVIWYTDAPPHTNFTDSSNDNIRKERIALENNFDWIVLSKQMVSLNSPIWFILPSYISHTSKAIYSYMSTITGGKTLLINIDSNLIGTTTVGIIVSIMGHKYDFLNAVECYTNLNISYENEDDFIIIKNNNIQTRPVNLQIQISSSNDIVNKFANNSDYKDKVYFVFENILNPELIKSLTYNPLFGTLWRAICKDRKDERRDVLLNKLSIVISNLTYTDKAIMQSFIEESYNQSNKIEELINSCDNKFPSIILEKNIVSKFTAKDILEITRSCSPFSLCQLCEILTSLKIVDNFNTKNKYIPIELNNSDLFACIPHLVVDGIMFSFRASIIMAMLVIYTGSEILQERARQFVIDSRGKWLLKDQPENFSYEFIKFALKVDRVCNGQCLTESERDTFKILHKIGGLKMNANTTLNMKIPFTSCKTRRPDYKIKCVKCCEMRSFTLMGKNNVCGLCFEESIDVLNIC